jgi:hypothetical protein
MQGTVVGDPGCLSRIRTFPSRIQGKKGTGSCIPDQDPQLRIVVFLTQKIVLRLAKI